jgi:hypothetical protein
MAILNNSNAISTAGGYDINNSLRFRSSASAYLNRTAGVAPTSNQKGTFSFWIKRGALSTATEQWLFSCTAVNRMGCFFGTSDRISMEYFNGLYLTPTQVFRDPSAWYHLVVAIDSTQATTANRAKMYVNGVQVTAFFNEQYPAQNATFDWAANGQICFINQIFSSGRYFDGYMAEFNYVDGQQLTPSSFGETDATTGVWQPAKYTGTYGTNGFYLNFSDIATTSGSNAGLGKDFSGNANYWTTNNISVTAGTTYDAMIDSPTLTSATVANYAVLNTLDKASTVTNANLTTSGGASHLAVRATVQIPSSGLYYYEATVLSTTSGSVFGGIGLATSSVSLPTSMYAQANGWFAYCGDFIYMDRNGTGTIFGGSTAAGSIIQIAIDRNNNRAWFGINNTWYDGSNGTTGNPSAGTNPTYTSIGSDVFPIFQTYNNTLNVNFGQRPFSYTPPTGFVRLNAFNLPDSTIKKGNTVMDATLYTGTATTQSITNAGSFKPDLVWVKIRSGSGQHVLTDSVRGVSKQVFSSLTNAETTEAGKGITAFNSNGFTLGDELAVTGSSNANAATYVGWQWQAGQGSTSSNTSGTITSTVSVNATAGFSVVTYTGTGSTATIGHGLGVAPKMIICKSRSATGGWNTYHADLGNTKGIYLNLTQATTTSANFWNNTSPTSTVFTLSGANETNTNGSTNVAYCWAEIAGFSRFGSYTGNGSADGPFIATNFKPKYVLIKNTTNYDWHVFDAARNTYNFTNSSLKPNTTGTEFTNNDVSVDFLSNGFKLRGTDLAINGNGNTHIYACFASNPFKISNAV